MQNQVLYEDNHLLIINKAPGQIVQGDKTGDRPLVEMAKDYIKEKYKKPGAVFLGVVHRLDRPASGVVLFARTSKALTRMNEQFRKKEPQKTYWIVTEKANIPQENQLENYLLKNQKQNKSYVVKPNRDGAKQALLNYKVLLHSDRYMLIEVDLQTGRHHQIRVQLSSIGAIIKGDLKYGADRPNKDKSIHLHARKLTFIHPTKKEKIEIEAAAPDDVLWNYFSAELAKAKR